MTRFPAALVGAAALLACTAGPDAADLGAAPETAATWATAAAAAWEWRLPPGFPEPRVPPDNPMSAEKVELGRLLFFDRRLSGNGALSCAGCHDPRRAFTDGRARARGSTGELHPRSAMSLANAAYNASLDWSDPAPGRLEAQMRTPMFGREPVELGIDPGGREVLGRLGADRRYRELFSRAFPGEQAPISLPNVIRAIACFERTLISGDSDYDRFVYWGEEEAMPEAARRGMRLFFSERLGCSRCHGGFNFSGPVDYAGAPGAEPAFHNTGLYDLDGRGAYPLDNRGLAEHTGREEDEGKFRAPTLRNIALTAPYMHDGSIASLEEVVEHYAAGGRAPGPRTSPLLAGFELEPGEKRDLVRFLESLTDRGFVGDPRFDDPYAEVGSTGSTTGPR